MKINLNIPFKNYAGEPIKENDKVVIIADFVGKALFSMNTKQQMEKDDMIKAYEIMRQLQHSPSEVKLTHEQITFLEEKMSGALTVGCYGQLYNILEQEDK